MHDHAARYAVYFVPAAESNLYRCGSAILGYDCHTGVDAALPDELAPDAAAWHRLTEEPRRYGFHATLKAPFHLSPACTEAQLESAFISFVGLGHHVARIAPEVRMLDGFVAVVPREPSPQVSALADRCTMLFDAFRAPMSARERARRVAANLSQSQMHNLERWGYPYLFKDFRFHMTLTGRVPAERRDEVLATLRGIFARMCGDRPIAIDHLALLRQDNEMARFRVICHAALKHGPSDA
jgi:hypothetical protein